MKNRNDNKTKYKPLSEGLGKMIYQRGLKFKIQKDGYDLAVDDDEIYSTITISTDVLTGEYEIELIPEKWEIQKAGNDTYFIDPNTLSVVDLSGSLSLQSAVNEYIDDETDVIVSDTVWYNHELNYIIRETPVIEVTNIDGSEFTGDTVVYFTNQLTRQPDTLYLGSGNPFAYPFFNQGSEYTAKIFIYELYNNPDHPAGPVTDKVPSTNATLTINNELLANSTEQTATTDENGEYLHIFKTGAPNTSTDSDGKSFTKTFEINVATSDNEYFAWEPDGSIFRAYLLGTKPTAGTDFVTFGPEIPEIILRDPPGSNSYAYIKQGSQYTSKQSWGVDISNSSGLGLTVKRGVKVEAGGGLAGPVISSQIIDAGKGGMEITSSYDDGGSYSETTTFTEQISTSSDPDDVGSNADLYIGKSYNAYISEATDLAVLPLEYCQNFLSPSQYIEPDSSISSGYAIGLINTIVMNDSEKSTYFIYSQAHIIHELIPDLIALRDNYLINDTCYTSVLPATHELFGLSNDDDKILEARDEIMANFGVTDTTQLSYSYTVTDENPIDQVAFLNQQVSLWISALATNEAEKTRASLVQNISFDGGGGSYQNSISVKQTSEDSYSTKRTFKVYADSRSGALFNTTGLILNSTFDFNLSSSAEGSSSVTNSLEFGYVLDDSDHGDYYSVDVKKTTGTSIFSSENFLSNYDDPAELLEEKAGWNGSGIFGAFSTGGIAARGLYEIGSQVASKSTSRMSYLTAIGAYLIDLTVFIIDMNKLENFADNIRDDGNGNKTYDITGFGISSPVFTITGGQSQCPYEPAEYTSFYLENDNFVQLSTATLQREVPVIDIEPSIISNVPENESATFELKLKNESESGSAQWYEISAVDESNPYGASFKIDGAAPYRKYLIQAGETLTKTLEVTKGQDDVLDYENLALVLHSSCQFDPTNYVDDIADTVYFSVHFMPKCTSVDIKNLQDDWVLNYEDDNQMNITLSDYNVNLSSLEMIEFQYKTLTGNAIGAKAWFADDGDAYNAYTGDKALLNGEGEVSFVWDASSLSDRQYMIRARSTCSDGSENQSDWYSGLFDTKPPKVFGTPSPGTGILEAGQDISIRFDEELEAGIINDNNFSIKGVLNGTEISHNASLHFDGADDYAYVNDGIFLNDKSFSIEFWLRRDTLADYVVVAQGEDAANNMEIGFDTSDNFYLQIDGQTFSADPGAAYTDTYPWNAWHHYAVVYDKDRKIVSMYIDDLTIFSQTGVTIEYSTSGKLLIGKSATGSSSPFAGNMHEFRIWDDARIFGELYSNISLTMSGRDAGSYRIWEMNEGKGDVISDKVRKQVMTLAADWAIEPEGYAVAFDGTDDYLEIPATKVVIDDETDMTMEFWFKGETPTSDATLLSNGKGDGHEYSVGNNSVYFDGADDYVEVQYNSNLNTNEFTIEVWAMVTGGDGLYRSVITSRSTTEGYMIYASKYNTWQFWTTNSSGHHKINGPQIETNTWTHLAFTCDSVGITTAYVNGAKVGSSSGYAANTQFPLRIGAGGTEYSNPFFLFTGNIDEARIWNVARTNEQISENMNKSIAATRDNLVAYYRCDDLFSEATATYNGNAFGDVALSSEFPDIEDVLRLYPASGTENNMSITAKTDGSIIVNSNGDAFEAANNNYFDNDWHHFAMVVDRDANTKAYIDGELQNSTSSENLAQFAAPKLFVGARGFQTSSVDYGSDQYFNGYMDEIRVWNTARTTEQLKLYGNAKLSGDEDGLLLYYPFEYYEEVMGVNILTETLNDQWTEAEGLSATAMNGATLCDEAPEIKDARPVQDVAFDFVINKDEIILTPTESTKKIENCILEITTKDVKDLNGNRLLSPASWTAYIDQNQVVWDTEVINLENEEYKPLAFTANISNLGGSYEIFEITSLPDWLDVSDQSGQLDPNSSEEITFIVSEALNTGEYEEIIHLENSTGYDELLTLKLRIYKSQPNWSVNSEDYENGMNIIGTLKLDGNYSTDEYDMLAAFVDDECRGVTNVKYVASMDEYFVFLTVYSDSITEEISYKVWDASKGHIYTDVSGAPDFTANTIAGLVTSPVTIEAGNTVVNEMDLKAGFNWVSFNLDMSGYSNISSLFNQLDAEEGDQVYEGSTGLYKTYDQYGWETGALAYVNTGLLYTISISNSGALSYSGEELDATQFPITIRNGWNRIGYIPNTNIEINQALAGYEATTGDIMKSQTQFAMFNGNDWIGNLTYLKPQQGYMLWSQTDSASGGDFYYPEKGTAATNKSKNKSEIGSDNDLNIFADMSINPYNYPASTSIIAEVMGAGVPTGAIIGAFINNELRGIAQQHASMPLWFVTVYGDETSNGNEIQFKIGIDENVYDLQGSTSYENLKAQGTLSLPVMLYLNREVTGINSQVTASSVDIFPNPFKNAVNISMQIGESSQVSVDIYNVLGMKIKTLTNGHLSSGTHNFIWNAGADKGIYFVKIITGNSEIVKRIVTVD